MVLFPKVILYLAVQMMADLVQIVTPDCVRADFPIHVQTCLIKPLGFRSDIGKATCLLRSCDLTATPARRDKAAHENVSRHLWHLHYWLALALVRTFSPFLSTDRTNAPASRLEHSRG
jgi:hypothetical protein